MKQMRKEQKENKDRLGYDRRCRYLTAAQRAEREAAGLTPVVRFAAPLEGTTTFHDAIRGDITYANEQITDQVLLKSDGLPTYHLANVVDDHLMQITHIMRADEWINTARYTSTCTKRSAGSNLFWRICPWCLVPAARAN